MRPLALAALLLPASVLAQTAPGDPAGVPVAKTFYEVVYEKGVDAAGAAKILDALKRIERDYPGLVTKAILGRVVFAAPDRELDSARYCWEKLPSGSDCSTARTVAIDVPSVLSCEAKYPDFYRKGHELEAVLFHELIHGWGHAQPERLVNYAEHASDGRLTAFARKSHKVFKHLWPIERHISRAQWRIEIGEDTRKQWLARAKKDELWLQKRRWRKAHAIPHQAAVDMLAKNMKKWEEKVGAFTRRENTPRRSDADVHALDNQQEWFAYGAEIMFFSTEAAELLTPEEIAWWKTAEGELKGGGPAASIGVPEQD